VLDIFGPSKNSVSNRDRLTVEVPRALKLRQRAVSSWDRPAWARAVAIDSAIPVPCRAALRQEPGSRHAL